ncbi:MAG: accessory factor UbiK family protein [Spongiibacteraceae bacterium]|jgi:BMFP domain-containing protein YqiC|nr:accessory factor UbiK family protein [Spongiibacteraceae bacterium]
MTNRDIFSQISQQLGSLLGQAPSPADLERKVRALVQSGLSRMDVVTREEFDAQAAVLSRTRARVEALERELETLRQQVEGAPGPDA